MTAKRKTRRTMTYVYLESRGACFEQLKLFKKVFGEQMILTVERGMRECRDHDFTPYWMVHCLSPKQKMKYNRHADKAWKAFYNRWNPITDALDFRWGNNDPREKKYDKASLIVQNRLTRLIFDMWINDPHPEYNRMA